MVRTVKVTVKVQNDFFLAVVFRHVQSWGSHLHNHVRRDEPRFFGKRAGGHLGDLDSAQVLVPNHGDADIVGGTGERPILCSPFLFGASLSPLSLKLCSMFYLGTEPVWTPQRNRNMVVWWSWCYEIDSDRPRC
jgi:hypothetical protein